jgi:hypothetical protein
MTMQYASLHSAPNPKAVCRPRINACHHIYMYEIAVAQLYFSLKTTETHLSLSQTRWYITNTDPLARPLASYGVLSHELSGNPPFAPAFFVLGGLADQPQSRWP